ncbi:hippurate hydrolase [Granulicella pectinivorans]|jgi:hippurate hydrolase|uniref:Hippurate hydrolase n=1 Tax=Granulicella pectinivorans TaxID=474950 RepID=A0A1I6LR81_9BACT|nr:amidohydrolase [Granulicella pectinivorans]SFS05800.1 hippurate hydrolase [Granulicella pectinivorans]
MLKAGVAALLVISGAALFGQDVAAFEKQEMPGLVTMYKGLHAHPELSHFEANTSAMVSAELKKAGYTVTDHVGVYPDGSKAYGVVGILKNGAGPTLLVRGDMDALPVIEETGVPYASHVMTKNKSGQEVGVMHACGHDVHTTVLVGTARALAANKGLWHGTLMIVGQPSEETIDGAKAMIADHLYERFGKPDMVIGLHDSAEHAAGTVAMRSGAAMASSTSIDVTIKGIGGHGARPNQGRDPVVLAAEFIMQLQTIVSREENPLDPSVVTVGDIHGGTKRNIIPNEVKLELTTRSLSDAGRKVILDGIRSMAAGIAVSAALPKGLEPVVTVLEDESAPLQYNDPALAERVHAALVKALGAEKVEPEPVAMGSEDVGVFGLDGKIPVMYYRLGSANPAKLAAAKAAGKELPGWHTSRFEPDPEPTLETGVKSLTAVSIALLQ